jgi:hypothetical protein
MCYWCTEDETITGKQKIHITKKTIEMAKAIQHIYDMPTGGAGGYGHIVFDDYNIEDNMISCCLEDAYEDSRKKEYTENTSGDEDGRTLEFIQLNIETLETFLTLDTDERYLSLFILDYDFDMLNRMLNHEAEISLDSLQETDILFNHYYEESD